MCRPHPWQPRRQAPPSMVPATPGWAVVGPSPSSGRPEPVRNATIEVVQAADYIGAEGQDDSLAAHGHMPGARATRRERDGPTGGAWPARRVSWPGPSSRCVAGVPSRPRCDRAWGVMLPEDFIQGLERFELIERPLFFGSPAGLVEACKRVRWRFAAGWPGLSVI